jgi:hypothetical protein
MMEGTFRDSSTGGTPKYKNCNEANKAFKYLLGCDAV